MCAVRATSRPTRSGSSVSTHGEPDAYNLGDPVRENKDTVIIFTALCARAAIEGGLSPRTAKALEVTYVRAAEQCARTSDLINLNTKMVQDFIRRVHASRAQPAMTLPVQECMEYVQTHLTEPFTLADLARHVGYTEYYLTKKFQKETGTKLADYIRGARLEQARLQLGDHTAQRAGHQRGNSSSVRPTISVRLLPAATAKAPRNTARALAWAAHRKRKQHTERRIDSMKLKQQADLAAFLEAVGQCRGNVHFNTAEGDSLNLQSVLSQYVFAALAGKPELWRSGEIVCDTAADLLRLHDFLE